MKPSLEECEKIIRERLMTTEKSGNDCFMSPLLEQKKPSCCHEHVLCGPEISVDLV